MKAIIVGHNRVEVCEVKKKDYEKTFFVHRQQLYMIMPGNLIRMRYFDKDGHEIREPDEVCVFQEGASVAYDTLMEDAYYQEAVLPSIDLFRDVKRGRLKGAGILQGLTSFIDQLYPILGLIIVVGVVGIALLTGGGT